MSLEAYSAEKDGENMDHRQTKQQVSGKVFVRSERQKILDKIRRIITAIDMELDEKEPHNEMIDMWAKQITDEIREFII